MPSVEHTAMEESEYETDSSEEEEDGDEPVTRREVDIVVPDGEAHKR